MNKPDKMIHILGGSTVGVIVLLVCLSIFTQNKILNSAEKFMGLIQNGQFEAAHEITAEEFKEETDAEELEAVFGEMDALFEGEFEFEIIDVQTFEDRTKEAMVQATAKNDTAAVFTIYLSKKHGESWEVLGIFLDDELNSFDSMSEPSIAYSWELNPEMPTDAEVKQMVEENLAVIVASMQTGDYVPFYNLFAEDVKAITSVQDIESAFRTYVSENPGAANLSGYELTINNDGYIHEEGIYITTGMLKKAEETYDFEIQFVKVDGVWQLSYIYMYPPK